MEIDWIACIIGAVILKFLSNRNNPSNPHYAINPNNSKNSNNYYSPCVYGGAWVWVGVCVWLVHVGVCLYVCGYVWKILYRDDLITQPTVIIPTIL
jgi:hypothetical protein